jgi:hypothetical protein
MTWTPKVRDGRGTFRERSRTFDDETKSWRIEGSFVVETVVFHISWDAQIDRGIELCIEEGTLRIENGERNFLVEQAPGMMARWRSR